MGSPTLVHTSVRGAEEAQNGPVVTGGPADQGSTDTFAARSFSTRLGAARRTALREPEAVAKLLSHWLSGDE